MQWYWNDIHQKAFANINATHKRCDLGLSWLFKGVWVYTDSSKTQLRAVINQNNRPIAFFSQKLPKAQKKYSLTGIKLLAIVETLKEFKGMLWGQEIMVYTDLENLPRDAWEFVSDRVYQWQLHLKNMAATSNLPTQYQMIRKTGRFLSNCWSF